MKGKKYEKFVEAFTWIVVILVIFGIRFLPKKLIDANEAFLLIGGISAFALLYYLVIYKYFSRPKRLYLKNIADIVLIGVLIHLVKDYGQYFFALYFLPIAAAALSLEFINALLIATIASLFVVFEVFLNSMNLLPESNVFYRGAWEIGLILLITIFCRFLAVQLHEEKAQKEEILAKQKALEEEAKKEKEFMGLTSHQLDTPLSIIRGFISMLDDGSLGELNPKQKEAVSEIYGNSKRMISLVSELLSISRIESETFKLNLQKTKLDQLVSNIINQFNQTKTKKEIAIHLTCPEDLKAISIDSDKIRQVLYNLLDNALKYSMKGKIEVLISQNKNETIVAVKDQGVGITEENREKLFQPFFRGKNILELDNQGTGLGLYIGRLLVEKHGGKIWAESPGDQKGSTFSFSLPNG